MNTCSVVGCSEQYHLSCVLRDFAMSINDRGLMQYGGPSYCDDHRDAYRQVHDQSPMAGGDDGSFADGGSAAAVVPAGSIMLDDDNVQPKVTSTDGDASVPRAVCVVPAAAPSSSINEVVVAGEDVPAGSTTAADDSEDKKQQLHTSSGASVEASKVVNDHADNQVNYEDDGTAQFDLLDRRNHLGNEQAHDGTPKEKEKDAQRVSDSKENDGAASAGVVSTNKDGAVANAGVGSVSSPFLPSILVETTADGGGETASTSRTASTDVYVDNSVELDDKDTSYSDGLKAAAAAASAAVAAAATFAAQCNLLQLIDSTIVDIANVQQLPDAGASTRQSYYNAHAHP